MDEPKALDSLFKQKIFRIPDYQRGYAWQREQLKAFSGRPRQFVRQSRTLHWRAHSEANPQRRTERKGVLAGRGSSYEVYHVVDGQQRLTTFIIFLQALVGFLKRLPEFAGKPDADIYVTENLNLSALQGNYLFKIKPSGDQFRIQVWLHGRQSQLRISEVPNPRRRRRGLHRGNLLHA